MLDIFRIWVYTIASNQIRRVLRMKKKEDFGMLVKKFREKNKLTVFQLARASGLSRDTIYKIERGDRSVSLITLYKVAAALDIPASFLV